MDGGLFAAETAVLFQHIGITNKGRRPETYKTRGRVSLRKKQEHLFVISMYRMTALEVSSECTRCM